MFVRGQLIFHSVGFGQFSLAGSTWCSVSLSARLASATFRVPRWWVWFSKCPRAPGSTENPTGSRESLRVLGQGALPKKCPQVLLLLLQEDELWELLQQRELGCSQKEKCCKWLFCGADTARDGLGGAALSWTCCLCWGLGSVEEHQGWADLSTSQLMYREVFTTACKEHSATPTSSPQHFANLTFGKGRKLMGG